MFTCIRTFTRCDNSYECFGRSLICPHLVRSKTPESTRVKGLLGHVHSDDHKTIHVYSRVDKYIVHARTRIVHYRLGNRKDRSYGSWVMATLLWGLQKRQQLSAACEGNRRRTTPSCQSPADSPSTCLQSAKP